MAPRPWRCAGASDEVPGGAAAWAARAVGPGRRRLNILAAPQTPARLACCCMPLAQERASCRVPRLPQQLCPIHAPTHVCICPGPAVWLCTRKWQTWPPIRSCTTPTLTAATSRRHTCPARAPSKCRCVASQLPRGGSGACRAALPAGPCRGFRRGLLPRIGAACWRRAVAPSAARCSCPAAGRLWAGPHVRAGPGQLLIRNSCCAGRRTKRGQRVGRNQQPPGRRQPAPQPAAAVVRAGAHGRGQQHAVHCQRRQRRFLPVCQPGGRLCGGAGQPWQPAGL